MLVLSRFEDEWILIEFAGAKIWLKVCGIQGKCVRLGIDAPSTAKILREEIIRRPKHNRPKGIARPPRAEDR